MANYQKSEVENRKDCLVGVGCRCRHPIKGKDQYQFIYYAKIRFSLLASTLSCFRFQVLLQYSPIVDILLLSRVNDLGYSLNIR